MRDLGLDGLSDDQRYVLLSDETGEQFRVPVDDRLRAASRGDRARLGQVEINMDSGLRPRDIQSRIRAGESPEAVAAVAQVSVERIMAYAGPVLAEREHVCQQARRSGLRRKHASGPGRLLGDAVDEHLRTRGLDPAGAGWDSWRRDDGRWSVTVAASRSGEPATFLFDVPGRYVVAHDDLARRLVGDEPPLSVEPEPDEPRMRNTPIAAATPLARLAPEPPVGAEPVDRAPVDVAPVDAAAVVAAADDAGPVDAAPVDAAPADAPVDAAPARSGPFDRLRRQRPTEPPTEQLAFDATPEPMADLPPARPAADTTGDDVDALARAVGDDIRAGESDTGRQRRRKPRSRASVPTWDEIMFGSKPQR